MPRSDRSGRADGDCGGVRCLCKKAGAMLPPFPKLSVLISATYQILICDTKKKHCCKPTCDTLIKQNDGTFFDWPVFCL